MEKSYRVVSLALFCLGFPIGCGGKQSSDIDLERLAACSGTYSGTYSGAASGNLTGALDSEGRFSVTFLQQGSSTGASGSGEVGSDGSVRLAVGENQIRGSFDTEPCQASGTWQLGSSASGTWEMRKL